MSVAIEIVDGPLADEPPAWTPPGDGGRTGALVCFEGIARGVEEGRPILALQYEAYEPMASRELRRLAEEVQREFELHGVYVEHSRGRIAVGARSFRLRIAAAHRKPALAAMEAFIDRLKRDVPIWKSAVLAE